MKKVFVGMFALMMLFGLATSCNSNVRSLDELMYEARMEGDDWSVDEWRAAARELVINLKPTFIEIKDIKDKLEKDPYNSELEDKLDELNEKIEKKFSEFDEIAEDTKNGKKLRYDKKFKQAILEEFPELHY